MKSDSPSIFVAEMTSFDGKNPRLFQPPVQALRETFSEIRPLMVSTASGFMVLTVSSLVALVALVRPSSSWDMKLGVPWYTTICLVGALEHGFYK